jgi:hypothetical protein
MTVIIEQGKQRVFACARDTPRWCAAAVGDLVELNDRICGCDW